MKPGVRITFHNDAMDFAIPDWVVDLDSFRRWTDADDFPDSVPICWMGGVWIDMSKEQLFTHGQVKTRIAYGLSGRIAEQGLGYYWADGPLVSNDAADLAVNPDGVFVSLDDIRTKQVVLREGWEEGHVEIQGAPSMVLEVVSRKSVQKDTVTLRDRYWRAGIPEYWLVDARKTPLSFDILRTTSRGYVATRKQDGWVRSQVFDGLFRLTQTSPKTSVSQSPGCPLVLAKP